MRDKFLLIFLFFLLMAAIPLGFLVRQNRTSPPAATPDEAVENPVAQAAALCKSTFCDEAIKAVAILQRTNAAAGTAADVQLDDISDKELYNRVKEIFNSSTEILTYQGKAVGIPVTLATDGSFRPSGSEAYLCAAASPWDCFSGETAGDGVSTAGLDYLCKKGLSAGEALRWYLPMLTLGTQ